MISSIFYPHFCGMYYKLSLDKGWFGLEQYWREPGQQNLQKGKSHAGDDLFDLWLSQNWSKLISLYFVEECRLYKKEHTNFAIFIQVKDIVSLI